MLLFKSKRQKCFCFSHLLLVDFTLVVLSIVCVILIVLSVLAFYVYRKRQGLRNKEGQKVTLFFKGFNL